MSRVLVVNTGSSSVKYRLYGGSAVVATGTVERIGEDSPGAPRDHAEALQGVMVDLPLDGLTAVGHRVVHGGLTFTAPTLLDDDVVKAIGDLVPLAPLHNPANLAGIDVTRKLLPGVPQVAVFDTAFHHTLPASASTYAIEAATAERHGIHRYGFHGTSHAIVSRRTAELLGRPLAEVNTITLHLGNGASACAVEGGRSVATSMGLSPLEGLVMGTRSGDIDPTIIFHLNRVAGMSLPEIDELLNRRSGLVGLAGVNDMRSLLGLRESGDAGAELAFDVYCRRVKSYVGAYYAQLGRLDAITFTAGVGENAPAVRACSLEGLERLGIAVDDDLNELPEVGARVISPPDLPVAVCVVPTDEEWEIASQTLEVVAR